MPHEAEVERKPGDPERAKKLKTIMDALKVVLGYDIVYFCGVKLRDDRGGALQETHVEGKASEYEMITCLEVFTEAVREDIHRQHALKRKSPHPTVQ